MSKKLVYFSLAVLVMAVEFNGSRLYSDQSENTAREYLESGEELHFTTITSEEAYAVILEAGINPDKIVYFDIAPYDVTGDEDFEVCWAAVVFKGKNLQGTFVHAISGELLAELVPLHEGFMAHLEDLGIMDGKVHNVLDGVGQAGYESYPWGYDLPTNWGNHALMCGYGGSNYHQGPNYYAVDLDTYDRECVPAPASGIVMYAGGNPNSGYGYQVIVLGMSLGSGKYYIYRIAHFDEIWVTAGWWVDKNRTLGLAGDTGWATGSHVHFSIHRGYYAGNGSISGESLPLDKWPGPNDRVDYFDRNAYWQFSFNVCK